MTTDDLQLARRAAAAGAAVGLRHFAALAGLARETKADGSVVTAADRAVEAAVREVIAGDRPGDAILGEEGGEQAGAQRPGGNGRRWIIDPIDGTALFVEGDDRWLVLIALEENGVITTGVAAIPAQGRVWWAARGRGAFEARDGDGAASDGAAGDGAAGSPAGDGAAGSPAGDGVAGSPAGDGARRIMVAPATTDVAASRLGVISVGTTVAAPLQRVVADRPWPFHPALMVARGDLDLAVQANGQVWDFAAISLIVTEAGGRYSGLTGRPEPAAGPSLYSASAGLHDAALDVLAPPRAAGTH
ncbi:inositol monophosphatase family protein [Mangrovihabitans endophyticus]|uniref:Histidinol-phosphatase n=1 Tax=Mangrovihabitans endophyticus TaxID=1751298 RepID=A0A8J3FPU6_9ACTN|nr:inositol monophosphatase family protein [Mangrovihabitans endophyticus]GGL04080.1 histidinol-phosphatase [Mangrovihabitans endophyticus]